MLSNAARALVCEPGKFTNLAGYRRAHALQKELFGVGKQNHGKGPVIFEWDPKCK